MPVPWLPARSAAAAVVDRSSPSPETVELPGQSAAGTPEPASEQDQATLTSSRYQPAALGEVVGVPVTTGAVRFILRPSNLLLAKLPATSWTETGPAVRSSPSPPTVVSAGTVPSSTPEVASV